MDPRKPEGAPDGAAPTVALIAPGDSEPVIRFVPRDVADQLQAKVDELHGVIDRAAEVLGAIPDEMLDPRREDPALGPYIGAILAARFILDEAEPQDLETPGGEPES